MYLKVVHFVEAGNWATQTQCIVQSNKGITYCVTIESHNSNIKMKSFQPSGDVVDRLALEIKILSTISCYLNRI